MSFSRFFRLALHTTAGGVPSGGVWGQRPYPPIRTPNAGETAGMSRNPPHWVHPLLGTDFII
jgi:hypothetical protein